MNTKMKIKSGLLCALLLTGVLFGGCSCKESKNEASDAVEKVADEMSGAGTIRRGEAIKDQLKGIQDDRNRQLQDQMDK